MKKLFFLIPTILLWSLSSSGQIFHDDDVEIYGKIEVKDSVKTLGGIYQWSGIAWEPISGSGSPGPTGVTGPTGADGVTGLTGSTGPTGLLENQVVVNQANYASKLGGVIDSNKEYFIDGVIDIGATSILVPTGGIQIKGYSFNTSGLTSSEPAYTMFTHSGGSGDVILINFAIEVTGAGSQVFDIQGATGDEALEILKVNFNSCTSLGEIDAYRQGLEDGTGRINGTPELTLSGNWIGGYRITTSIARNVGSSTLFKAGTELVLNGRFFSDFNMEGQTNAVFADFSPSNIAHDSEFEIIDANFNGVLDPFPNFPSTSVKSRFRNCLLEAPSKNTYVGARYTISSSAITSVSFSNTPVKIAGTTAYEDEQWWGNTTDNAFLYLSTQEIEIVIIGKASFTGGNNDQLNVIIKQWDDSAGGYIDVSESGKVTLNGGGGSRAEGVALLGYATVCENDRIEIWGENQTDSSNFTMDTALISVSERAN